MRPDRGAGRQQFLSHDIAFEHAALAAAIALRPGHPDPATRAEPPAERRRPMAAEIAVRHPEAGGELPGNELAHLGPQRRAFRRQLDRIETEGGTHRAPSGGGSKAASSRSITTRNGGKSICTASHTCCAATSS